MMKFFDRISRFLFFFALVFMLLLGQNGNAQQTLRQPRLQVIHAASDPALNRVNISVANGSTSSEVLPNARFGGVSPMLTKLGEVDISSFLGVTSFLEYAYSGQTSPAARLQMAVGRTDNVVVALGVLQSRFTNFQPNPAGQGTVLRLVQIYDTTTVVPDSTVRLTLVHGVTDAQRLDVVVRETGQLLGRLDYPQTASINVPLGDYTIDIRFSTSQTVAASFLAPLRAYNLNAQRATAVLTGFLNPDKNLNGASLSVILAGVNTLQIDSLTTAQSVFLPETLKPVAPSAQPRTRVQVIDNAADAARLPLSAFINARAPNSTTTTVAQLGQILQFRQATQTISTTPVVIVVQPRPLQITTAILDLDNVVGSQISALFLRLRPLPGRPPQPPTQQNAPTVILQRGWNKIIASGVIDTADYARNPDGINIGTRLSSFIDRADSVAPDSVRILLYQGVTDLRRVNMDIRGGDSLGTLLYGEGRFITLPAQQFIVDLVAYDNDEVLGAFTLPLFEYAGQRISVMTSGFVNPAGNGNGQPLGMLLVPESPSTTNRIRLLSAAPLLAGVAETTLQMIQTSAEPAFTNTRVVMRFPASGGFGATLLLSNPRLGFNGADTALTGFGTFVPFLKEIVGVPLTALVGRPGAAANTSYFEQPNFVLQRGVNVGFLSGFLDPLNFPVNPENLVTKARINQFIDRSRFNAPDSVRLLVYHSSTDAPRVNIQTRANASMPSQTLATLSYGEGAWLNVPLDDYTIDVAVAGRGNVLASYNAPFRQLGLGGQRISVFASGVVNQPRNQWLPSFGLYAASNAARRPFENITSSSLTTVSPQTSFNAISATGNTVVTTTFVQTTSANGETTETITVSKAIFTPNPVPPGTRPGTFFPTSVLTLVTTTVTITTTVNASFVSYVTTTTVSLYNGEITATTFATVLRYATTSTLLLNRALESVPLPPTATAVTVSQEQSVAKVSVAPNPAQSDASLSYTLNKDATVTISIYDALGQFVATVETSSRKIAGEYVLPISTANLPSGSYEVRVFADDGVKVAKMFVVR